MSDGLTPYSCSKMPRIHTSAVSWYSGTPTSLPLRSAWLPQAAVGTHVDHRVAEASRHERRNANIAALIARSLEDIAVERQLGDVEFLVSGCPKKNLFRLERNVVDLAPFDPDAAVHDRAGAIVISASQGQGKHFSPLSWLPHQPDTGTCIDLRAVDHILLVRVVVDASRQGRLRAIAAAGTPRSRHRRASLPGSRTTNCGRSPRTVAAASDNSRTSGSDSAVQFASHALMFLDRNRDVLRLGVHVFLDVRATHSRRQAYIDLGACLWWRLGCGRPRP